MAHKEKKMAWYEKVEEGKRVLNCYRERRKRATGKQKDEQKEKELGLGLGSDTVCPVEENRRVPFGLELAQTTEVLAVPRHWSLVTMGIVDIDLQPLCTAHGRQLLANRGRKFLHGRQEAPVRHHDRDDAID